MTGPSSPDLVWIWTKCQIKPLMKMLIFAKTNYLGWIFNQMINETWFCHNEDAVLFFKKDIYRNILKTEEQERSMHHFIQSLTQQSFYQLKNGHQITRGRIQTLRFWVQRRRAEFLPLLSRHLHSGWKENSGFPTLEILLPSDCLNKFKKWSARSRPQSTSVVPPAATQNHRTGSLGKNFGCARHFLADSDLIHF